MQPVKTVLLVDDEAGILDLYLAFLAPGARPNQAGMASRDAVLAPVATLEGHRFLLARSGEEAVQHVCEELSAGGRVACGFFDVQLPGGMDGAETLRQVRALDADVLCTIVTGHQDRSVGEVAALFGPDRLDEWDYLSKPFTKWEVVQKCRQMVESWNRRRREERQLALNAALVAELGALNRELERRVAWRTADLEGTNRRLCEANASLRQTLDDLQRAQRQLVQSEKMASIGQLAAGVGHEINNPVAYVHSNLGSLRACVERLTAFVARLDRDVVPAVAAGEGSAALRALVTAREQCRVDAMLAELPEVVSQSLDGTDRIRRIVASLRTFSHPGTGARCPADVNDGLRATLALARSEIGRHADVEADLAEVPAVLCNVPELNQVWLNLFVNAAQAVEATGRRGRVVVSSRHEEDHVVVRVRDDGCGMPPEVAARVFDPFFTTKEAGNGTGLGLALAHAIVERHGGGIAVLSAPGAGTSFVVTLPVAPALHAASASLPAPGVVP